MSTYPYNMTFADLVEALSDSVDQCFARWGRFVPMENILLVAGLDISDSGDSQRCSRAIQVLRKRGRIRYRRDQRAWEVIDAT